MTVFRELRKGEVKYLKSTNYLRGYDVSAANILYYKIQTLQVGGAVFMECDKDEATIFRMRLRAFCQFRLMPVIYSTKFITCNIAIDNKPNTVTGLLFTRTK